MAVATSKMNESYVDSNLRGSARSEFEYTMDLFIFAGNLGAVFVEQSFWQCGVATKPQQGVFGFLAGGLTWFSVPFVFGTTMGLAYLALGELKGSPLLTDDEITQGFLIIYLKEPSKYKATSWIFIVNILNSILGF